MHGLSTHDEQGEGGGGGSSTYSFKAKAPLNDTMSP